jgi:DNA-binding response OmpR family regulator
MTVPSYLATMPPWTPVNGDVVVLHRSGVRATAAGVAKWMSAAGFAVDLLAISARIASVLEVRDPDLIVIVRDHASADLTALYASLGHLRGRRVVIDYSMQSAQRLSPEEEDVVVAALDAGADDYVAAPEGHEVISVRLQLALRGVPPSRRAGRRRGSAAL